MKQHLTPDGWKRCSATTKPCTYDKHTNSNAQTLINQTVKDVQAGKKGAVNKFFDFLSAISKNSTPAPEPQKTVTPPTTQPATPDKTSKIPAVLTRNKEGRYQTYAAGYNNEPLLHVFSDLTTDIESVKKLHEADPEKFYQTGDCGVLANEIWNLNEHVEGYYVIKTDADNLHDFVKLKDGTYADSLGIWSQKAMTETWKQVDPTSTIAPWDDNEPEPEKDLTTPISNPALFTAVTNVINTHMKKYNQ